MAFVMIDDMRMFYTEEGRQDGPPLLMLHSFTGTGDFWVNQTARLGSQYHLIIPDLRGHGRTDNPSGLTAMNHRQFARDVIALCGKLRIERAAFCGDALVRCCFSH